MSTRRQGPMDATAPPRTRPTTAQLGSSLRAYIEAARAIGNPHHWRPAADSTCATTWRRASHDALSRTICEADVHAILLTRSGLEHAAATAQAISANHPFIPHTLGRTASEHLLRAQHLVDNDADDPERARRRLNEWLYAITESNFRREGVIRAGHVSRTDVGRDREALVAEVVERASALGESLTGTAKSGASPRVTGTEGRLSTIALAELYTAGETMGVPTFTMRGYAAIAHGTELGLLACATEDAPPSPAVGDIVVPVPRPMAVPDMAFNLLSVALTTVNAVEALQTRFEWPAHLRLNRRYERAKTTMSRLWSDAVTSD